MSLTLQGMERMPGKESKKSGILGHTQTQNPESEDAAKVAGRQRQSLELLILVMKE